MEQISMHEPVIYRGKEYCFGYYSRVLGKVVIYEDCERHGRHLFLAEIPEVEKK